MSLASLSRDEREELIARGLTEKDLYFVESLVAKKQVVILEEMLARHANGRYPIRTVIRDEQRALIRGARLLAMSLRPYRMAHFQSTLIKAFWRRSDGRVVREIL